ncbi:MAG: glutamate formimidoyltransferase [Chloroflexi bacterium]|nr:glutamate formimidoyltransferase [Chloroflexota bacterium]
MSALIECVANFSEGRRSAVVESIVGAIADTSGATVLGYESDSDHNRAVVTFVGAPDSVAEAAFAGISRAADSIDMDEHRGQHPRIGAADVVPFVPLRGACMDECVRQARALAARVGAELRLPVFLYERAALQDVNRNLADIRRGGYEGLKRQLAAGEPPLPDYGPRKLGSAGGCVIGARDILIAFNVFLTTDDVAAARQIARRIRASSGGLPHVKALGLRVRGQAQVSMNLTNYRVTSIARVVEAIEREARTFGVDIASSQIVGLIPADALTAAEAERLRVENYSPARILERHLDKIK